MQKAKVFILMVLWALTIQAYGKQELLPIDSLYLGKTVSFYQFAEKHKAAIWPGMELAPACLYRSNGPVFLYNHPNPPEGFVKISENLYSGWHKDLQLYGNTITEINGTLTAIADYGSGQVAHPHEVLAVLFHELHHAYQMNNIEGLRADNPVKLMTYPEMPENDALKLFEQNLLYEMVFTKNAEDLQDMINKLYSSRLERKEMIGDYLLNEKAVENFEGPAVYSEYSFYQLYSDDPPSMKRNYFERQFGNLLTIPYYGREKLRARNLVSGLALCLVLDNFHEDWKKEYYPSGMDLYDFFLSKFEPVTVDLPEMNMLKAKSRFHTTKAIENRMALLDGFMEQPGKQVILEFSSIPQFRGFDPMNAQSINDSTVLHKTLLKLANGDNTLFFDKHPVLAGIKGQVWFVEQLKLFIPEEALKVNGEEIIIDHPGVNIRWKGRVVERKANLVRVQCD